LVRQERLLDEVPAMVQEQHVSSGVPGHEHDAYFRPVFLHQLGDGGTGTVRHNDIGEQEVDGLRSGLLDLDCLGSAAGREHTKTGAFQNFANDIAHDWLVLSAAPDMRYLS